MNLVNKQVTHQIFGDGKIIENDDSYLIVNFPSGNKKFVYPDAFETFLKIDDSEITNLINKRLEEKNKERKKEALRIKKIKALQEEKRQIRLQQEWTNRMASTRKSHPSVQSVFWCKEQELDDIFENWNVFTGTIKSGPKKGEPRRLARVNQSSACLLTVRESIKSEDKRRVLGVFMVRDDFDGRECEDGYIPAHSKYRIRLTEEESEKILFWNYYFDRKNPTRITWNTGRHRYFENIWMAQILQEIAGIKSDPEEQKEVESFLRYFCQMNQINQDDLEKPNGALMQA